MPTWLRYSKSSEENLETLRTAMLESFFTETEALKLSFAIEEAAGGDRNKMAGAADFCLIMVETMEMGLSALIAAAFHFCSCVTAREQSLLMPAGSSYEYPEHKSLSSFGEHATTIARDAAKLKKLEMVAGSIVQGSTSRVARVSPDARDSQNLQRLLLTQTEDWRALAIRSAACLFRLRGLTEGLTPEAVRVAREALHIFAPLASRLGMHRLKNELEDAAFSLLYRRQYNVVTALQDGAETVGDSMKLVLDDVTTQVRTMLEEDPEFSSVAENVVVTARVKEPYSMWRKMLRSNNKHVLNVPDALALRIVLDAKKQSEDEDPAVTRARKRALCYYVQELCTKRWEPLADNPRFKDYIEHPKGNGYQSLHYTGSTHWQGEDWKVEFQIRTHEMHKVAEYGLASHVDYKAKSQNKDYKPPGTQFSDAYLRKVQDWHGTISASEWDSSPSTPEPLFFGDQTESQLRAERIRARTARLAPYLEALNEAQSDLAREHVFVFLSHSQDVQRPPEGKVLALPSGACVLDALREGERSLGLQLNWREEQSLVKHNGSLANVTQKLKNGDILTVPLQTESAYQQ
jgi:(p)ppGpp synthase/HD superfamily hydrolase